MTDRLLIIDFGSQVTQLIARRLRELSVYCEIHPFQNVTNTFLKEFAPKAVILSGGPASVYDDGAPMPPSSVFDLGIPVLGICYGQQVMMHCLGGLVERGAGTAESGGAYVTPQTGSLALLDGWFDAGEEQVWMSHGDHVSRIAPGFEVYGTSPNAPFAITADTSRNFFGVQFHPEVSHTERGRELLENFLVRVCELPCDWRPESILEREIAKVRAQVGETGEVVLGLSGGVDSSVAAMILHRAIGERLHSIFVDNGLLRKGERDAVERTFREHFHMDPLVVDAADRFLDRARRRHDPETQAQDHRPRVRRGLPRGGEELRGARFLGQGTLYPDVIESVVAHGGRTAIIKSHHNVGGLPERLDMELVEPLRELFKDEVRELGRELGLRRAARRPPAVPRAGPRRAHPRRGHARAGRHPAQEADAIVIERDPQAPACTSDSGSTSPCCCRSSSVGVMGDARTYENACALRVVESLDGMTADWGHLPHELLARFRTASSTRCAASTGWC